MPRLKKHQSLKTAEALLKYAQTNLEETKKQLTIASAGPCLEDLIENRSPALHDMILAADMSESSMTMIVLTEVFECVLRERFEEVTKIIKKLKLTPHSTLDLLVFVVLWAEKVWIVENKPLIKLGDLLNMAENGPYLRSKYAEYAEEQRLRELNDDEHELWQMALSEENDQYWNLHQKLSAIISGASRIICNGADINDVISQEMKPFQIVKVEAEIISIDDNDEDEELPPFEYEPNEELEAVIEENTIDEDF